MLHVSWKSPSIFQGRQYGNHKLELDVKEKEETQSHNTNILSFTELRVSEMSFLAIQEETFDILGIELFKFMYTH